MVEIITIGDELLIGQVINTNASWMAQQLNLAGYDVRQVTSVSDQKSEIMRALEEASGRAEIILLTGGLGPTKDDITKDVLCNFFSTSLIVDEKVLGMIGSFFARKGLPLTAINRDQALVPKNALVVENQLGTAPGLAFEKDGKLYIAMPGVPYEMKYIMETFVIPALLKRSGGMHILHRTILTQGIGESFLSEIIKDWEESLAPHIKLAYLPSPGIVRLRLSARGNDSELLEQLLALRIAELKSLIPQYIWGEGEDTLEIVAGRRLRQKGMTLATAESCTGGHIAHRITSVAGSSEYFKGSVVAYENEVKKSLLGVKDETLQSFGAVSKEVVEEMAVGVQKLLHADYAIAVSGIAGPGGGTAEKPVGTVWIAIAGPNGSMTSKKFLFGDDRQRNILRSTHAALGLLQGIISNQT
jgi:nicotinamide-nucleotide amidase